LARYLEVKLSLADKDAKTPPQVSQYRIQPYIPLEIEAHQADSLKIGPYARCMRMQPKPSAQELSHSFLQAQSSPEAMSPDLCEIPSTYPCLTLVDMTSHLKTTFASSQTPGILLQKRAAVPHFVL
jgi:hypothetical protein